MIEQWPGTAFDWTMIWSVYGPLNRLYSDSLILFVFVFEINVINK